MRPEWTPARGCEGWALDLGPVPLHASLHIVVHKHPAAPEIWCLTALQAGFDLHELKAKDGPAAQAEALELLERVLSRRLLLLRWARGVGSNRAAAQAVRTARARLTKKTTAVTDGEEKRA